MTPRALAASAAILALSLAGAATAFSGDTARPAETPSVVATAHAAAPDFVGLGNWFNSAPLKLADLRGKVVLVNFWTYGCVNCVNTLPHVTGLYAKYKDRGLVVVGIHTPEFPFERSASNVQAALKRHGIIYPVAQDNDSQTWNAWHKVSSIRPTPTGRGSFGSGSTEISAATASPPTLRRCNAWVSAVSPSWMWTRARPRDRTRSAHRHG